MTNDCPGDQASFVENNTEGGIDLTVEEDSTIEILRRAGSNQPIGPVDAREHELLSPGSIVEQFDDKTNHSINGWRG